MNNTLLIIALIVAFGMIIGKRLSCKIKSNVGHNQLVKQECEIIIKHAKREVEIIKDSSGWFVIMADGAECLRHPPENSNNPISINELSSYLRDNTSLLVKFT